MSLFAISISALLFSVAISEHASAQISASDTQRTGNSFVDRFDRLDRDRWYISHGWANGAYQHCTFAAGNVKTNTAVELSLIDTPTPERPFTCAEIQTRQFLGYGTYEVRLRPVIAPGTVTAFFTYTGPPHGKGWPHDEVDFEFLGRATRGIFLNYFAAGRKHEKYVDLDFDTATSVNDYAFVWLPDSIRWFANGKPIREAKSESGDPVPSHAQKLYLSIWNGAGPDMEAWLGRFAYPGAPLVAKYEYVAFTRMGDVCQFPTSIVCQKPEVTR